MTTRNLRRLLVMAALFVVAAPAFAQGGPYRFSALTPCRLIDTRQPANAPALSAFTTRSFKLRGSCGLPTTAMAAALNVTVITPSTKGHLRVAPSDVPMPNVSTLNFAGGENAVANGAIVPLAADTGSVTDISVFLYMIAAGNAHLVIDVTGYFAPPTP